MANDFPNTTDPSQKMPYHPQFFPLLNMSCEVILEELAAKLNLGQEKPFNNVMIVAVQHILDTTIQMFRVFKKLGLEHAVVGGKSYSTHKPSIEELKKMGYIFIDAPDQLGYGRFDGCMQATVAQIWQTAMQALKHKLTVSKKPIDLLIILDDGGDLILATPAELFNGIRHKPNCVIGIEQTRGGSNHPCFNGLPFPIINVAGSYVKTTLEYPFVAEIIAAKVLTEVQKKTKTIPEFSSKPIVGVIGFGTMGKAIVKSFREKGYRVLVHDNNLYKNADERPIDKRASIATLISDADIIIGCTGTDVSAEALPTILSSIKPKCFASTSSKDLEFNRLLLHIQEQTKQLEKTPDPLADIEYSNPEEPDSAKIFILKGGFPINFDNQKHSVPPEKIWPTRACLMSACLMAVQAYTKKLLNKPAVLKLDAHAQLLILKKYTEMNPHNPLLYTTKKMQDTALETYIETNSDGTNCKIFKPTSPICTKEPLKPLLRSSL